jgi:hypothetical protein
MPLKTFIDAHNSGFLDNITLSQQHVVNLHVPCIFNIGDMQQGGDKMCCSLAGYSNKMACLCQKRNVRMRTLATLLFNVNV